ncbi:MAG: glycoside hydrolase family 127 protein [Clostridia bacterium]|nr:glycoside hydrolase family 127 protein [Clostridia bacterium]
MSITINKQAVLPNKIQPLSVGAMQWQGDFARVTDLIMRRQFMRDRWWTILTEQFSQRLDGHNNGWRGEYWGKLMRGACLVYTATADEELYATLVQAVELLLKRQDDEGRISSYNKEHEFNGWDMWGRKYVMLGCEYFLEICRDDELKERVIAALMRHADYIVDHIGDGEGKKSIFETSMIWGCVNSSSILEPFVRLYNLTGEQRYFDFATYIVEAGGSADENVFEKAALGEVYPYQFKVTKAYEMMSCFEGLLEYYRVTGEEKWKTAVLNLVDMVAESEITIVGCGGCTHELFDHSAVEQFNMEKATGPMLETCVTVTWMKLCWRAYCLTGDCRYVDYVERAYFNAMLGAVNTENSPENGGLTFDSYSPLIHSTRGKGIGGLQNLNWLYFSGCCDSIGACGIGIGALFAVMQDEDGAVVNTYMPGEATVVHGDASVTLRFDSVYPKAGDIRVAVTASAPCEMTMKFRIPKFSATSALTVNGEAFPCAAGEYTAITRVWKTGDVVEVALDMSVRAITPAAYGAEGVDMVAYEAGPLVLARDARFGDDMDCKLSPAAVFEAKAVENPAFHSNVCYAIPQADGTAVLLADYASCGKTMNEASMTTVWMQVETENK